MPRTIILYPGYMTNPSKLSTLKTRLVNEGHIVEDWVLNYNTGMSIGKFQQLLDQINCLQATYSQKVHIVGHSLGGTIGRALSNIAPNSISHVTTIGSPINNIRQALDKLKFAQDLVHGRVSTLDEWEAYKDLVCLPPSVKCTSIWSTDDTVVPWRESILPASEGDNVPVSGKHLTLPDDKEVQDTVAKLMVENLQTTSYNIRT